MKSRNLYILNLILLIVFIVYSFHVASQKDQEIEKYKLYTNALKEIIKNQQQSLEVYKTPKSVQNGNVAVNGVYNRNVMVVYLENRTWASVMETCNHEYLHHKLRTHFDKDLK